MRASDRQVCALTTGALDGTRELGNPARAHFERSLSGLPYPEQVARVRPPLPLERAVVGDQVGPPQGGQPATPATPTPTTPARETPAPAAAPRPRVTFSRIRAANTPQSMRDRIPPTRPHHVQVDVSGGDGRTPIELSVLNYEESISVNSAPRHTVTHSGRVTLSSFASTPPNAAFPRLVAKVGGQEVGTSNPFAVAAIPSQMIVSGLSPRGIFAPDGERAVSQPVETTWRSDSGLESDLDQVHLSERVEIAAADGMFANATVHQTGYLANNATVRPITDNHYVRLTRLTQPGNYEAHQTFMFSDAITGTSDAPVPHSGFVIRRQVVDLGNNQLQLTTTKVGRATSALGVSSSAGRGQAGGVTWTGPGQGSGH